MLQLIINLFGILFLLYTLTKLVRHAGLFLLPSSLSDYLSPNHESWALITGSTAGIGFGFAQELCAQGFNVILHGKDDKVLQLAAARLQREFPQRRIRTFLFDASKNTITHLDYYLVVALRDKDKDRLFPLRILINNIGGQSGQTKTIYQRLADYSSEEVSCVMNVNAHFTTQITRALLPVLSLSASSLIINISSLSAPGLPYLCVYAPCKSYIESFTRSLRAELHAEQAPIDVMGIMCGAVQSQGHRLQTGLFVPTSRAMARAALRQVRRKPGPGGSGSTFGLRELVLGQPALVTAYWPHAVQEWVFGILPEMAREWASIWVIRGMMKADMEGRKEKEK